MLDGYTTEVGEFQQLDEDIRHLETISSMFSSSLEKTVQQMVPKMIEGIYQYKSIINQIFASF